MGKIETRGMCIIIYVSPAARNIPPVILLLVPGISLPVSLNMIMK